MKKFRILLIMAVAFIASGISASAQTLADLRLAVEMLNAECPQDMGDGMTIQQMILDDNDIVATVMTNEDDATIKMISIMVDELAPTFIEQFKTDPEMNAFLMLCKQNQVNFNMVFTNHNGVKATLKMRYQDM